MRPTQLAKIVKRAGLDPWPKLWHNLRATRETELAETFPIHVVCAWIGNSQAVAKNHYLQTTDEHFRQAADCSELQKALHQSDKSRCEAMQERKENPGKHDVSRILRGVPMGVTGPEQAPEMREKQEGGADVAQYNGTVQPGPTQMDPDLAAVVEAWPRLSAEVRKKIVQTACRS